jgi:hypothetical protein
VKHQRDRDYLVYPIILLYRRHIELALKEIILRAPYLIERPLTKDEKGHLGKHRLDFLWQDLKPMFAAICKAVGWESSTDDLDGVDDYVRQLSAVDADSFSSRYARSKKGDRSLPPELGRINLRHLAEMLERLADYLDGIDGAIGQVEEFKSEMASDADYT